MRGRAARPRFADAPPDRISVDPVFPIRRLASQAATAVGGGGGEPQAVITIEEGSGTASGITPGWNRSDRSLVPGVFASPRNPPPGAETPKSSCSVFRSDEWV